MIHNAELIPPPLEHAGRLTGRDDLTVAEWARLFTALADSALDAFVATDATGRVVEWNRAAEETFGYAADEAIGAALGTLIVPADMVAAHDAAMARYAASREARIIGRRIEIDAVDKQGDRFRVELAIAPLEFRGALYFVARIRNIAERERAARQIELVAKDLDHRVKNTLAVFLAIARQTAKAATDLDDFMRTFEDRVLSHKRAHDLVSLGQGEGVDLKALFSAELAAFSDHRIEIEGPDLYLPPRTALTLGLCIHEMTTNAAKHGALSAFLGSVRVSWRLDAEGLVIDWAEHGGPKPNPVRRGFGSTLVKKGMQDDLGGTFVLDYPDTGLVGQVRIPLRAIV